MSKQYKTQVYENVPNIGDEFYCIDLRPTASGIQTKRVKTKVIAIEQVSANASFASGNVRKTYDKAWVITSVTFKRLKKLQEALVQLDSEAKT